MIYTKIGLIGNDLLFFLVYDKNSRNGGSGVRFSVLSDLKALFSPIKI